MIFSILLLFIFSHNAHAETEVRVRDRCQKYTNGLSCWWHRKSCEWIPINGTKICVSRASNQKVKANQLTHLAQSLSPPQASCPADSESLSQGNQSVPMAHPEKVIELLAEKIPTVFSDFIEASPVLSEKGEADLQQTLSQICPILKMYPNISVRLTGVTYSDKKNKDQPLSKKPLETTSDEETQKREALKTEKANLLDLEQLLDKTKDPIEVENYTASIEVVRGRIRILERVIDLKFGKNGMYQRVLEWAKELNYPVGKVPTVGDEFYLLSMKRAQTISQRLKECGATDKQLSFTGSKKGESQKGSNPSQNRRVDLEYRILKE